MSEKDTREIKIFIEHKGKKILLNDFIKTSDSNSSYLVLMNITKSIEEIIKKNEKLQNKKISVFLKFDEQKNLSVDDIEIE